MLKLMERDKSKIENFMQKALQDGVFPGAVLGIVTDKGLIYKKAFGYRQLKPEKKEMNSDTIFDLASLTKVIATTTTVMQLIEKGMLNLWDFLFRFYPDIHEDKKHITIFHLLTHTSGYQAIVRLWDLGLDYDGKINYILNLPLEYKTGSQVVYSDPNFILLGDLIYRVTGQRLDEYTEENIFKPLGMNSTVFNPLKKLSSTDNIATTEWCNWRNKMVIGEVHDENAASFGGVSGHAGLFSTLDDLALFVQMLLNEGKLQDIRILSPSAVKLMRKDWTPTLNNHRSLGWDLVKNPHSSGGVLLSEEGFGHTGFTGTSLWVDPVLKVGVILLTNRVHPTRENAKIIILRPRLHNLIISTLLSNQG